MIPVIIEDLIGKVTDKNLHSDKKQHYANTLYDIREQVDRALKQYETERNFKK